MKAKLTPVEQEARAWKRVSGALARVGVARRRLRRTLRRMRKEGQRTGTWWGTDMMKMVLEHQRQEHRWKRSQARARLREAWDRWLHLQQKH